MKRLALRLAFASGLTGLMYEVLWLRIFTGILGSSTLSVSAVVSVFLLGTALGAYVFGKLCDRFVSQLKAYALLEGGAAVVAALAAFVFFGAGSGGWFDDQSLPQGSEFMLALAFVFLPAFFVGATVPVLAAASIRLGEESRKDLSALYLNHSLGAALGAVGTVFLVGKIGYASTYAATVGIGVSVALLAWLVAAKGWLATNSEVAKASKTPAAETHDHDPPPPSEDPRTSPKLSRWIYVSFATGFGGLAFEVVWFRVASHVNQATLPAFGALLGTYLLGMSLGSLFSARLRSIKNEPRFVAMLLSCASLFCLVALPAVVYAGENSEDKPKALVSLLLAGLTFTLGSAYPLVVRLHVAEIGHMGRGVGTLNALNTLGSVLGSMLAGYVLLPLIGTQLTLLLVASMLVVAAATALSRQFRMNARYALAAALLIIPAATWLSVGDWLERFVALSGKEPGIRVLELRENKMQTLSVLATKEHRYLMGGPFISGTSHRLRRRTQRYQGHLPLLVHPHPEKVMEIGYGVGEILRSVLIHNPKHVDLVEIDGEMLDVANEYFAELNGNASEDPRVHVHIADGRRFLRETPEHYDVILTDSMMLVSEASFRLYTIEHFRWGYEKLNESGAMVVWLPLYIGEERAQAVIRTFLKVFPETTLWVPANARYTEGFLIGHKSGFNLDCAKTCARFDEVNAELREAGLESCSDFLATMRAGPQELAQWTAGSDTINSDLRPVLDYIPLGGYEQLKQKVLVDPAASLERLPYSNCQTEQLEQIEQLREVRRGEEAALARVLDEEQKAPFPEMTALHQRYPESAAIARNLAELWTIEAQTLKGPEREAALDQAYRADPYLKNPALHAYNQMCTKGERSRARELLDQLATTYPFDEQIHSLSAAGACRTP